MVSNGLNPPKTKFSRSDFTKFSKQVSASSHNFRFRSFHSLNIFKLCQTVVGISIISKFHEFSDLIFGGFLQIGPTEMYGGIRNGGYVIEVRSAQLLDF